LFSAVAYYFAKSLREKLRVPVGIVVMSCGATRAETWTDLQILKSDTAVKPMLDYWGRNANGPTASVNFMPGKFYDDVIKPIAPYTARGLIWYQGESNSFPDNNTRSVAERADEYKYLLPDLIKSYRQTWKNNDLPVYIVQLPNFKFPTGDFQWAKIRQAQLDAAMNINHTGLAVTIDVGDSTNLHPTNKQPVGERLANWALAKQYGFKNIAFSGPIITGVHITGSKVVLIFKYTTGGLNAKSGTKLSGFEIASALSPNVFIPAIATINSDKIVVTNASVKDPVAVRYAWADAPKATLFNGAGLPASPFMVTKTDLKTN
jgi:hypothetical protein